MKWPIRLTALACYMVLSGCANQNGLSATSGTQSAANAPQVKWQSDDFTHLAVPSVEDIFYLNDLSKMDFLSFYHDPKNQSIEGHKRLAKYLDNFMGGFTYKGNTYTADLASTEHAGNCLSLAILTKAYASLVDLKVEFRKVNSAPIYSRENGIMSVSSHVQTHVFAPARSTSKFNLYFAKVIIDYFPSTSSVLGDVVNDDEFVSMYYQNLAAKALMEKQFNLAYSLLSAALDISPNNIQTLNTLAVLYKKRGNFAQAEELYKYLLEHTKGSVMALSNYVLLLENSNRNEEAALYNHKYLQIEDDNPYQWFDLANQAYSRAEYRKALYLFKKSAKMAPYLHESFFGQAKSYYQLGNKSAASRAMQKAVELAYSNTDEKLYSAKLQILRNHH